MAQGVDPTSLDTDSESVQRQADAGDGTPSLQPLEKLLVPVVEHLLLRAAPRPGERVLDLGTGAGAAALGAAAMVGGWGQVVGVDANADLLDVARQRASALGLEQATFRNGRAEAIPAETGHFDIVLASLSLMYAVNRDAVAAEIARVLRRGGRLVAAVWGAAEECDIVAFQDMASRLSSFEHSVGPGSLGNPIPFLVQLGHVGIHAWCESETLGFSIEDFESAWGSLAGNAVSELQEEQIRATKDLVKASMWPDGDGPRDFRNTTHFIVGEKKR